MGYKNFELDLEDGKKGEKIVYNFLEENGLTYVHSNDDYKYDFMMLKNDKNVKYEVKTDKPYVKKEMISTVETIFGFNSEETSKLISQYLKF